MDFLQPFSCTAGPRDAKVVAVGEAFGESEDKLKTPFAGESGKELWRMLGEAWPDVDPKEHKFICSCMKSDKLWTQERGTWLNKAGLLLTNSFNLRPKDNKIEEICGTRAEVGKDYNLPLLRQGKYVKREFFDHTERLRQELEAVRPNLIICLGNVACWSVLRATNISAIRGNVTHGMLAKYKVLPTYHPAMILRAWEQRPILVADLRKAGREKEFPEIRRPERWVTVFPSFEEINDWVKRNRHAPIISCDIETRNGQITDIGFSSSPREAIVITFVYGDTHPNRGESVYQTAEEELLAWQCVDDILNLPGEKLGQNFLYDLQYLMRMGFRPRNVRHDTMLLSHSLWPEMKKSLGFLGSIWTNEASWKLMRSSKSEELKRDE